MISRFFKKKPKASEPKKTDSEKPERRESPRESPPKKLLTAEGWKRLMMRKTGKTK
jgi:hypothetical protein